MLILEQTHADRAPSVWRNCITGEPCGDESVVERADLEPGALEMTDINSEKYGGFQSLRCGETVGGMEGSRASFSEGEEGRRKLWEGGS